MGKVLFSGGGCTFGDRQKFPGRLSLVNIIDVSSVNVKIMCVCVYFLYIQLKYAVLHPVLVNVTF